CRLDYFYLKNEKLFARHQVQPVNSRVHSMLMQAGYARWTHWQYHQPSYCFECIPGLEEQLFRIVRPYQGSGRYFLWQSRTTDPACNRYRDQPEGYQVFSGNKNGCCRKYPNVY